MLNLYEKNEIIKLYQDSVMNAQTVSLQFGTGAADSVHVGEAWGKVAGIRETAVKLGMLDYQLVQGRV